MPTASTFKPWAGRGSAFFLQLDAHVEILAPAAVFGDGAGAQLMVGQDVAVPQGQLHTLGGHLAGIVADRTCLQGNPAQAAASAAARDAPAQLHALELAPANGELVSDLQNTREPIVKPSLLAPLRYLWSSKLPMNRHSRSQTLKLSALQ